MRQKDVAVARITDADTGHSAFLDLAQLRLTAVPPAALHLASLQGLFLEGNQIESLPDLVFTGLPSLTYLDVRNNRIGELPPSVGTHRKLQTLLLEGNALESLPVELCEAESLTALSLSGNPLTFPPEDVVASGIESVLEFLRLRLPIPPSPSPLPPSPSPLPEDAALPGAGPSVSVSPPLLPTTTPGSPRSSVLIPLDGNPDALNLPTAAASVRLPSLGGMSIGDDEGNAQRAPASASQNQNPAGADVEEDDGYAEVEEDDGQEGGGGGHEEDPLSLPHQHHRRRRRSVSAPTQRQRTDPQSGRNYRSPDHSELFGQDYGPAIASTMVDVPLTAAQIHSARAASSRHRVQVEEKIKTESAKRRSRHAAQGGSASGSGSHSTTDRSAAASAGAGPRASDSTTTPSAEDGA
eukprot:m.191821 g.191821  ORF g.191821 m.191821 type:complete len:410 (+) comp18465_c0_seq1:246-1475(+)